MGHYHKHTAITTITRAHYHNYTATRPITEIKRPITDYTAIPNYTANYQNYTGTIP